MLRPECLGETVTVRWPAVQHLPSQGHTHTHTQTSTKSWRVLSGRQVTATGGMRSQPDSTSTGSKLSPEDNAVKFLIYFLPLP